MKMKRLISAALTVVMSLALAVPAFAAADPLNPSVAITSTTQMPTINMVLPTSPAIVLNPYKLKVTIGSLKDQTDQIVSPIMSVTNLSDVDMQIAVGASVKLGGEAALNSSTAVAETDKKVMLTLKGEIGDKAGTFKDGGTPVTKTLASTDATTPDDFSADFAYATVPAANASKNVLAAAVNGKVAATGGVFNFQFTGDASKKASWTAKDTVTPTVVFKFIPYVA